MTRLSAQDRKVLIETLSERPFSVATAIGGVTAWFVLIGVTFFFAAGER